MYICLCSILLCVVVMIKTNMFISMYLYCYYHYNTNYHYYNCYIQNKHNEEMAIELTNSNTQLHSLTTKHNEEIKILKQKNKELQDMVDEINQRIDLEVTDIEAIRSEEDNYSVDSPDYRRDSYSMSRYGSFVESPNPNLRTVSFILGPQYNNTTSSNANYTTTSNASSINNSVANSPINQNHKNNSPFRTIITTTNMHFSSS